MRKKIILRYHRGPMKTSLYEAEFGPEEYAEYYIDELRMKDKLDYKSVKTFIEDNWEYVSDSIQDDDEFADWLRDRYYDDVPESDMEESNICSIYCGF